MVETIYKYSKLSVIRNSQVYVILIFIEPNLKNVILIILSKLKHSNTILNLQETFLEQNKPHDIDNVKIRFSGIFISFLSDLQYELFLLL